MDNLSKEGAKLLVWRKASNNEGLSGKSKDYPPGV